jgi:hypothetical protein
MRKLGLVILVCISLVSVARAADLRPLSAADQAKFAELLRSFDPNSYDVHLNYTDSKGHVKGFQAGKARGLANLRQSETVRPGDKGAAARITIILTTIYSRPIVLVVINIFKDTNFKSADQQTKAAQLNQILQKYYVGQ